MGLCETNGSIAELVYSGGANPTDTAMVYGTVPFENGLACCHVAAHYAFVKGGDGGGARGGYSVP